MEFTIIPVTPYLQNCSLVWDHVGHAALIDPGGEIERLLAEISARNLTLEKVLLTHGHLDHVGAADELRTRFGIPIEGPERTEQFWFDALPQQAQMFGFPPAKAFIPDRWLQDGETVSVGSLSFDVLHCPGHTPGHVVFFHASSRLALVGDVLFKGSIGRTDFPKGDFDALISSIRNRLWPLGDDVAFIPGHGPMSTFGHERATNPLVGDAALARQAPVP